MKQFISLLAGVILLGCSGSPEPPISLNGPWFFWADSNQVGVAEEWFTQDFDFTRGDTIALSESWESVLKADYDGVGWYFCEFSYPPRTQQIALVLRTFDDAVKVWLNGQPVGEMPENPDLMKFELTPYILQGRNRLAIQVTDRAGPGGIQDAVRLVPFRGGVELEKIQ